MRSPLGRTQLASICMRLKEHAAQRLKPRQNSDLDNSTSITTKEPFSVHKFRVGQSVSFTPGLPGGGPGGVYKITQLLPPEGDDFQYKIKSAAEPHERVARESQLDRAA